MRIKILHTFEHEVINSVNEETCTIDSDIDVFQKNEYHDVDIIQEDSYKADFQFGDGSCIFGIAKHLYEEVKP